MTGEKKVYIILVNYNQWQDTVECVESILKNNYRNYQIVIVENNSSNHSLEHIVSWAEGKEMVHFHPPGSIVDLSHPSSPKPVPLLIYQTEESVNGGNRASEQELETILAAPDSPLRYPLIILQNKTDKGFAAANNLALQYAIKKGDMAYAWLLNNDTVISNTALTELVMQSSIENGSKGKLGIIGSTLLFYDKPDVIQAIGGRFNIRTSRSKLIGTGELDTGTFDKEKISFDYVPGASMFVCRQFIEQVGFMNERYYLYYEEIDWAVRGKRKGWKMDYCRQSKVYHKQGVTTGKKLESKKMSLFILCLKSRNLLTFYRTYYPYLLPVAYVRLIYKSMKAFKGGNHEHGILILRIVLGKKTCDRSLDD